MYNRYIPRSDGTYRKQRLQERTPPPKPSPAPQPTEPPAPYSAPPEPPGKPLPPPRPRKSHPRREPESLSAFWRQLLPKGFDTADLLVVVLLLLMCGEERDDQNTALLTLALYLFM